MERPNTWNRTAEVLPRRKAERTKPRAYPKVSLGIHPRQWVLEYPAAVATVLLCVSLLVYLLQVNQASWLQFNLTQASVTQSRLNAVNAHLLVQKDALLAESRIDSIATTKLHMEHPSLSTAIWLHVRIPPTVPAAPHQPAIQSSPLSWMENAITTVGDSL